jgi:mRNA interferase RelE/StbE
MSRALQIYYTAFDAKFLALPGQVRDRIEAAIDDMGMRLAFYPHYRMTGSRNCRLRVGDYRVVYAFDLAKNEIHLLAVGHRREIYR